MVRKDTKEKQKMKSNKQVISSNELMMHSSGKMGKHMDLVKSGCGAHRSKKEFTRKEKHKAAYL